MILTLIFVAVMYIHLSNYTFETFVTDCGMNIIAAVSGETGVDLCLMR
jgi:hypothetical protein